MTVSDLGRHSVTIMGYDPVNHVFAPLEINTIITDNFNGEIYGTLVVPAGGSGSGGPVTAVAGAFVDGAIVTIGSIGDLAWTSGNGTVISLLKKIVAELAALSVTVSNFPATQPVSGSVSVSNLPVTQPVSGSVNVGNFPATQPVSGTVGVNNLPATQAVSGTVSVSDFPATQAVSGSVSVSDFPSPQPVSGTVSTAMSTAVQTVSSNMASGLANSLTIAAVASKNIYLIALYVFASVGTVTGTVDVSVTGLNGGTITIPILLSTGAAAVNEKLNLSPSAAMVAPVNTAVTVSLPAFSGGGETTIIAQYIQQ